MGKSLKKRYSKKGKSYVNKALGYATGGMMGGDKDDDSSSAPAAQQYEMKDVARSRAAGSGTFNYTDQELRPK